MERTITVRITDDIKKDLDELSASEHKPVSDIVRESIRRYVAIRKFRKLRNMVLPFAESRGILTDEDVFDIIS